MITKFNYILWYTIIEGKTNKTFDKHKKKFTSEDTNRVLKIIDDKTNTTPCSILSEDYIFEEYINAPYVNINKYDENHILSNDNGVLYMVKIDVNQKKQWRKLYTSPSEAVYYSSYFQWYHYLKLFNFNYMFYSKKFKLLKKLLSFIYENGEPNISYVLLFNKKKYVVGIITTNFYS